MTMKQWGHREGEAEREDVKFLRGQIIEKLILHSIEYVKDYNTC